MVLGKKDKLYKIVSLLDMVKIIENENIVILLNFIDKYINGTSK
jgi:hypothetical protein